MTQNELAQDLKVGSTTVVQWEKSRNSPNMEMLQIIADYFNVSPNYLLGYDNIKQSDGEELSLGEKQALDEFRQLDEPEQHRSIGYMRALRENKQANERLQKKR